MTTRTSLCLSLTLAVAVCSAGPFASRAHAFEQPTWLFEFGGGSPESPYLFSLPTGMGVDSVTGAVYVTNGVDGLKKFDGDGNFITEWDAGDARAVDANTVTHDVYVARPGPAQIAQYTAEGVFIREWGSQGTADGQFSYPHSLAVDSSTGEVYVFDGTRVQVFDAAGTYLRKWGSVGTGPGQFSGARSPFSVAFDPATRSVWVSDLTQDKIEKFDEWGNFLLSWETTESPCGCQSPDQLRWVREISVGGDGNLYVADADGERISVWSPAGVCVDSFKGPHNPVDGPFHPRGVAVNRATGEIYVAAGYAARVDEFDASRTYVRSWGDRERNGSTFFAPKGIAVSPVSEEVYVLDSQNHLLKRFTATGGFLNQWGKPGRLEANSSETPEGLISFWSSGIGVDAAGDIWYAHVWTHYAGDTVPYAVQRFDGEGVFQSGWPIPGGDTAGTTVNNGLAIDDSTGRIYVSSETGVVAYDASGTLLDTNYDPTLLGGLAVHGSFLYAVDPIAMELRKYDLDVNLIAQWGSPGTADGQFKFARSSGIATDSAGTLYVADTYNNRIQVFDPNGSFLGKFGSWGYSAGSFRSPSGVAVNKASKTLYVLEVKSERVQAFALETATACADGVDNDGDELIDYPDDPACSSLSDTSEDHTRLFCVSGSSNAIGWSWRASSVGFYAENLAVAPVPGGGDAGALARRFTRSVNAAGHPGLTASVDPDASHCFAVTVADASQTFALCVGSTGQAPSCCVRPSRSCTFNPELFEFDIGPPRAGGWRFWGPAQGGTIDFIMEGRVIQVATTPGDSGLQIASAVASAINGNSALAAMGVIAAAGGELVTTNGRVTAFAVHDPGIGFNPSSGPRVPSLPASGVWLLTALVLASGALSVGRRRLGSRRFRWAQSSFGGSDRAPVNTSSSGCLSTPATRFGEKESWRGRKKLSHDGQSPSVPSCMLPANS